MKPFSACTGTDHLYPCTWYSAVRSGLGCATHGMLIYSHHPFQYMSICLAARGVSVVSADALLAILAVSM